MSDGIAFDRAYLEGRWRIARRIVDRLGRGRRPGGDFRVDFAGQAFLSGGPEGSLWHAERGELRLPTARLIAARRYQWRFEDGATLRFEDGRLLVAFEADALARRAARGARARVSASHLCGEDQYDASLRVLGPSAWRLAWRVRGPRKNMTIASLFRRE